MFHLSPLPAVRRSILLLLPHESDRDKTAEFSFFACALNVDATDAEPEPELFRSGIKRVDSR